MSSSFNSKCCNFVSKINAEPIIFISMLGAGLAGQIISLFFYFARCVELFDQYPSDGDVNVNATYLCKNLDKFNQSYQDVLEDDVAKWNVYIQMAYSVPCMIAVPIVGVWSDRKGRKLPLIVGCLGCCLCFCGFILATLFYKSVSVLPILIASNFVLGLSGGYSSIFVVAFALVTDLARDQMTQGNTEVPLRIAVASGLQVSGLTLGSLLAFAITEVFEQSTSYFYGSLFGALFLFAALLYAIFFVKETMPCAESGVSSSTLPVTDDDGDDELLADHQTSTGACSVLRGAFRKCRSLVIDLFSVLCVERPGYSRLCLNMCLLFLFVEVMSLGDLGLLMLLVKRAPFFWNDSQYAMYSVAKGALSAIGMILLPVLFKRLHFFKGKDSVLILMGIAAAATLSFALSVVKTDQVLILLTLLCLFTGAVSPGYRSLLPKLVSKHETARLYSAFSVVINLCPVISAFLFNNLFRMTMDTWPGFAFFIGGIIELTVFMGQLVVHFLLKPTWSSSTPSDSQAADQQIIDGDDDEEPLLGANGNEEELGASATDTLVTA